jgi:hypothetical protein
MGSALHGLFSMIRRSFLIPRSPALDGLDRLDRILSREQVGHPGRAVRDRHKDVL